MPIPFITYWRAFARTDTDTKQEPRPHWVWVADWKIHLYDGADPINVFGAYSHVQGGHYVFGAQRPPEGDSRWPQEYIKARFERGSVRGITSHNWRPEDLGVW